MLMEWLAASWSSVHSERHTLTDTHRHIIQLMDYCLQHLPSAPDRRLLCGWLPAGQVACQAGQRTPRRRCERPPHTDLTAPQHANNNHTSVVVVVVINTHTNTHARTHTRLMALCQGLSG